MSHADRKSSCSRLRAGVRPAILSLVLACALPLAATVAVAAANHVLLAEIQTISSTSAGRLASEFIAIVNPTSGAIDLSDYYLTDATFSPGNQFYWRIAEDNPSGTTAGGGSFSDFHARFPAGYSIAAGDTVVIAVAGGSGAYQAAYGHLPDFEVYEDGTVPDQVPELREAFPGAISAGLSGGTNTPSLTDGYESLVLYTWNGSDDLVQDVDFAFWGGGSTASQFDKTGVTVGTHTYANDTPVASQQTITTSAITSPGNAYLRKSADEGAETATGGNGITGHDETSEPLSSTWQVVAQVVPAPPTTFFPTVPLITAHSVTPPSPYEGQEVTLSITASPPETLSGVTFYVAYDGGTFNSVNGTDAGGGTFTTTLAGRSEGTHVAWYAVATNNTGGEATYPALGESSPEEWTVAAIPPPSTDPDKLLLSEICTLGTAQEFIEIYNPNDQAVDMTDYYITDAVHNADNPYWKLSDPSSVVGGGSYNDFFARFPSGFTIASGDTIVVSIPGSDSFFASYGMYPELELYEDGDTPDNVMDMLPVWGSGSNSSIRGPGSDPTLTNGGEVVVLLYWDGTSDLVKDIDIFDWFDPSYTSTSFMVDKSGVTVGSSTYGPDTPVGNQTPFGVQLDFGNSYQRVDVTEGAQSGTIGNGIDGTDETSEDFNNTFAMLPADPSPPGVTNPLAPAITLESGAGASPGANQPLVGRISIDSPTPVTSVDFYYKVSTGDFIQVPGVMVSAGSYTGDIPGQPFGTEVYWYIEVTNEGGYTARLPLAAPSATFSYTVGADPFGLVIQPKTFIPDQGEKFPIKFNTKPNSETRLRIFDMEGRLVITLYDSRFGSDISTEAGKYSKISWDGRDETFERVKAGMYILHLSVVDNQTGKEESWKAPVVVATRLSN